MSTPDPVFGKRIDDGRGETFPCRECGSDMVFAPGGKDLVCQNCSSKREIVIDDEQEVVEQDFQLLLQRLKESLSQAAPPAEHQEVRCEGCGANVVFVGNLTSTRCAYCGTPLQRTKIHQGGNRIQVEAIIPFQIEERRARQIFRDWVRSRWFAPNKFKHAGDDGRFQGTYLPYWTFDAMTRSQYRGERGRHYYVHVGTGKNTSLQRRTRWSPASGTVDHFFDDTLILAARGLPTGLIESLPPWNLKLAVPFTSAFLAGISSRTYDVELDDAYLQARMKMDEVIKELCRKDIGGDDQRVHRVQTQLSNITCKHILLPIWILAYQFHGKNFLVTVNAVTGKIMGYRPYSAAKITLVVLAALAVVLAIYCGTQ